MSEIFNLLKRARREREKGQVVAAEAQLKVAAPPQDAGRHEEAESPIWEPVDLRPFGIVVKNDATFDLARADARIQTVLDPMTLIGEQYRLLRARLTLVQRERGLKTLLVTSSVAEEGKTFTACCLAGVFAQEPGKRVLLMDADLRKPRADRSLGIDRNGDLTGLSQVLRGEALCENALIAASSLNLFFMPAGPVPDNPAELLSGPVFGEILRELTEHFDWIVLDSPPVLSLADASLIAPFCQATLLIVRTERTPAKLVKEAIGRIGKERICGLVMNRGRHHRAARYYYRYYKQYSKKPQ